MNTITIRALKYDGRPHVEWKAELLLESAQRVVVLTHPGTVFIHHTKNLRVQIDYYSLAVFEAGQWYNAMLDFHADGSPRGVYCNVALPVDLPIKRVQGALEWVDLDLDVIMEPGEAPCVVDEDEFEDNGAAYGYSSEVIVAAREAAVVLMARAEQGSEPFRWWNMDDAIEHYVAESPE